MNEFGRACDRMILKINVRKIEAIIFNGKVKDGELKVKLIGEEILKNQNYKDLGEC